MDSMAGSQSDTSDAKPVMPVTNARSPTSYAVWDGKLPTFTNIFNNRISTKNYFQPVVIADGVRPSGEAIPLLKHEKCHKYSRI